MEFNKEWFKEEIDKLDEGNIGGVHKFILQLLVTHLNYIAEEGIKNRKDYERVKKNIINNNSLSEGDSKKAKVFRDLK